MGLKSFSKEFPVALRTMKDNLMKMVLWGSVMSQPRNFKPPTGYHQCTRSSDVSHYFKCLGWSVTLHQTRKKGRRQGLHLQNSSRASHPEATTTSWLFEDHECENVD